MLPEQDPQAPIVDTPEPSAPDSGTPEPQINWQKRYEDLRPQFDRTNQQLNDPEYQRQLMAQWGYEVEDAQPEQEWVDPTDELRQELNELKQWRDQRTQAEQEQEQLQRITASVDDQFKAAQADLDPATREWVTTRALNMDPREDGMPDIAGALEAYGAWVEGQQQKWEEQRRKPRAPKIPSGGQEGTSAPNLDDRQARRDWMAEQLAARES
jgi:chromosome segregation ATPase